MTMPAETTDIDQAIASFRAGAAASSSEGLAPRGWSEDDWRELFRFTGLRRIGAADALIRRGESDRTALFRHPRSPIGAHSLRRWHKHGPPNPSGARFCARRAILLRR
jgi:hypothetical protein